MELTYKEIKTLWKIVDYAANEDWGDIPESERTITSEEFKLADEVCNRLYDYWDERRAYE